jgi:hypothetical protein
MSKFFKYKYFSKVRLSFTRGFPVKKLCKFKRSKWKSVTRFLKKRLRKWSKKLLRRRRLRRIKGFAFISKKRRRRSKYLVAKNQFLLWRSRIHYSYLRYGYRNAFALKRNIMFLFSRALSIKYFKKGSLNKYLSWLRLLVKPMFRVDIFLWKIKFFVSVRSAQQYIKTFGVYLNGIKKYHYFFLKRGDIIRLMDSVHFKPFRKKFGKIFFFSFCEFDSYTRSIIILKDFSCFSKIDTSFVHHRNSIPVQGFIRYLMQK